MSLNYNYALPNNNLTQLTEAMNENIHNSINCCKIAKVIEFNSETLTVKCRIMNKKLTGLNKDGSQILKDYPVVYARLHTIGWGNIGITHPIVEGQEGFLLFNDKELETWFLTGDTGLLKYDRTHDLTDAIFICGLHSTPNIDLVKYVEDNLNIFYNDTNILVSDSGVVINGNLTVNGSITATGDIIANGISLINHVHGNGNEGQDTTKAK